MLRCISSVLLTLILSAALPAATREQNVTADSNNPTVSFGVTPTEGNLLIITAFQRSGVSHTSFSIDGTGWTATDGVDVSLGDATYRRSAKIYYKVAGASEPTDIQVSGCFCRLVAEEFAHETGEDQWIYEDSANNNNGNVSDATSSDSGTTAALTGTDFLVITMVAHKRGPTNADQDWSWDGGVGSAINFPGANNQNSRHIGSGFLNTTATGAKNFTGTLTAVPGSGIDNSGHIAWVIVFDIEAAAAGAIMVPQVFTY